jgi:CRISPR-associated endonuclease Csn1
MSVKKNIPYTLGLDIGIASVGWCVLGAESILALGVRAFDVAEVPKTGAPLNADRRSKRLMRRRLRRRAHRLLRLRRLCKREGLCAPDAPDSALLSPWVLRVEGLDRLLTSAEWQVVIHHLVKNRGFHSNRKSELNPTDRETGQLLAGLDANQHLLATGHYRTAAELAHRHESFALHKRNKAGAYTLSFTRQSLADELGCLFAAQRERGNCHASEGFEQQVMTLFWSQRPPLTGEDMLKLLGRCSLEKTDYRAPKCSHSAERFIWLSKLNNLRVLDGEVERSLTGAERDALINLPFCGKSDKVRYVDIRKILARTFDFDTAIRFKGLAYRYDGSDKNPENTTLFSPVGWTGLRRAYEKAGLPTQWQMLAQQPERLDVAAIMVIPSARNSRANSTTRMAFLLASAIISTSPTWV